MFNYKLMKEMGLIENEADGNEFISNVIEKLKTLETQHTNIDNDYITHIENLVLENKIVLGSPILKNILLEEEPVNSCTVVPINLNNDIDNLYPILEPYANNTVGSGYDLNQVDNPCATIQKINDAIHELIKIYPNRLSAMGTLDISSPEIINFINLKRNINYNYCHYNISVNIPDNFFEKGKKYEVIYKGKKVKIPNYKILNLLSKSIHYCGEPGIIFSDRFEETNPLDDDKYKYKSVAPCAEIAMAEGEVCQFSYINLSEMIDDNGNLNKEELQLTIKIITRMLDNLCDVSIKNARANSDIIEDKRRIGIGVCGFADMLAKLRIPYDSEEALSLAENIFSYINFYSKVESVRLAMQRGPFRKFNESQCNNTDWFNKFIKKDNWVTKLEWETLKKGIQKYGIRNSSTTAIPPTGRSSLIVNSSFSIEPYFSLLDSIGKLKSTFLEYINENYSKEEKKEIVKQVLETGDCSKLSKEYHILKSIFKTALEINPKNHIDMVKTINNCVDESVSKTVNLPNQTSVDEISKYIIYAHESGLNGITFFRDRCLEEREL